MSQKRWSDEDGGERSDGNHRERRRVAPNGRSFDHARVIGGAAFLYRLLNEPLDQVR